MKGINKALETKPGTSLDTVTSLPHATANSRARDNVSSDVCSAEINSTNFCSGVQRKCPSAMDTALTITGTGLKK